MGYNLPPLHMTIKNQSAFTLIELLIGVTISAILMTGIIVFVWSSLGSSMTIRNTLEESGKNELFDQRLTQTVGNVTGSGVYATGSNFWGGYLTGIFLRTDGSNLPITFLGLTTETGYCDSLSGTATATGTVLKLALRQFVLPSLGNSPPYTLSATGNMVYSGSDIIIGNISPWDELTSSGIDTELWSPSALARSWNHLYVADTMNDRILSYDIANGSITQILGRENGIMKPTSLYFSGSSLLVASSGNGRIFMLSDGEGNGSTFSGTFRVAKAFSANIIRFTFPDIPTIMAPTGHGSFHLSSFWSPSDTVSTWSTLTYVFSGSTPSFVTGTDYTFVIDSISPVPTNFWNHIVTIDFLSGSTLRSSDTFAYFTKGDGSLETNTGNSLRTLSGFFVYPHHITSAEAWSGTIDWGMILGQNPPWEEIHSYLPVQDLNFEVNGKVLTVKYREYMKYDCIAGKHQMQERLAKILLR